MMVTLSPWSFQNAWSQATSNLVLPCLCTVYTYAAMIFPLCATHYLPLGIVHFYNC
jgi:hypothetical protein